MYRRLVTLRVKKKSSYPCFVKFKKMHFPVEECFRFKIMYCFAGKSKTFLEKRPFLKISRYYLRYFIQDDYGI